MSVIDLSNGSYLAFDCFSHVSKVDQVICDFKHILWVLRFIVLVSHEAVVVNHASDIHVIFELIVLLTFELPNTAKFFHLPQALASE